MTVAASFLGGAKSRLLPASIPFRFFAAASVFHVFAWLTLLAGAADLLEYRGGPGLLLASLHLLTLGTLVMAAMGAAFQLLPVATVQPLARVWPARASFWLAVPGVGALAYGMAVGDMTALSVGAFASTLAVGVFGTAIADNLRRARSLPLVAAHGWAALGALFGLVLLALLLIADLHHGLLDDHAAVALAHFILATFGFMGLLALGFSYVLVPMFALSKSPPATPGWASLSLAVVAIAGAAAGILLGNPRAVAAAALMGIAATGLHLVPMAWSWRRRMRKRMGLSFVMIRLAWVFLIAAVGLGLAVAGGVPIPQGGILFVFLALVGWLLTFLTGVLQRILPFLASMHAGRRGGRPPMQSELYPETPLRVHAACHCVALVLVAGGLVLELEPLLQLGAASGSVGAFAFAAFAFTVIRRTAASQAD